MMAKVKIKFTSGAIRRLMADPAVAADVAARAAAVAAAANAGSSFGGYEHEVSTAGARPRARVWNVKSGASDDEARNNRLVRSLDAGR